MTSKPCWSKIVPVLVTDRMPTPSYYGMMGVASSTIIIMMLIHKDTIVVWEHIAHMILKALLTNNRLNGCD